MARWTIETRLHRLRQLPQDFCIERIIHLLASDVLADRAAATRMLGELDGGTADLRIVRTATAPWQSPVGRARLLQGLNLARQRRRVRQKG